MLEHIPKTKDELLQEMDVLAASLTGGLDSAPGEDRAEGDPEAEAPMLLQELRHLLPASCSFTSQRCDAECWM
ncbi:arsB [Symbiodinium necroappetens]|uniref:ArsB protein n=1 Tax=Symbiodinium necroappetens TaxID=1628268 RepID=A0A813AGB9_9DINO|nr:arsB [Symbiodinium necroappetens]